MLARETLEEFRLECQLRRLTVRTIKSYYNSTSLFLTYLERHQKINVLEEIRPQHIKQYIQYLIQKNLSPSYINSILRCIRAYFRYAVEEQYLSSNPAVKISWQKQGKVIINTFTDAEVKALLDVFDFSSFLSARNTVLDASLLVQADDIVTVFLKFKPSITNERLALAGYYSLLNQYESMHLYD